jgi:hypothetical protein
MKSICESTKGFSRVPVMYHLSKAGTTFYTGGPLRRTTVRLRSSETCAPCILSSLLAILTHDFPYLSHWSFHD